MTEAEEKDAQDRLGAALDEIDWPADIKPQMLIVLCKKDDRVIGQSAIAKDAHPSVLPDLILEASTACRERFGPKVDILVHGIQLGVLVKQAATELTEEERAGAKAIVTAFLRKVYDRRRAEGIPPSGILDGLCFSLGVAESKMLTPEQLIELGLSF